MNRPEHALPARRVKPRRPPTSAPAAVDALEPRRLLAATPPTFVVIADTSQTAGNARRAINYYDVSALNNPASAAAVFQGKPLFSVWIGYEITRNTASPRNFEEISALTVNPANGDTYQLAFDSISGANEGTPDVVGDTSGDFDLYRINFARVYNDFVANNRPRGVMYTDATSIDFNATTGEGIDYVATYGGQAAGPTGLPSVTPNNVGVPPGRDTSDADASNDIVFLAGAVDKVGEIGRVQGATGTSFTDPGFFNEMDLQFVDPSTLLLTENNNLAGTLERQIRVVKRVAAAPGAAVRRLGPVTNENVYGGYNGETTESWESQVLTGDNFVNLDDPAANDTSDVDGMRYVERDGVRGVWVSERDNADTGAPSTGDPFAFYQIDFAALTIQRRELRVGAAPFPTVYALDDNPAANDNNGAVGYFDVDENGNLVIQERNAYQATAAEPQFVTQPVASYAAGDSNANGNAEVTLGTAAASGPITSVTPDDDATVIDRSPDIARPVGVYERGQKYEYVFDIDAGAAPAGTADVYVVDANPASPTFGKVVYGEVDSIPHFLTDANVVRAFTLGDFAGQDGRVGAADIDALFARAADPTAGGRFPAAVGREAFDLTGDDNLTTTPGGGGDVDVLVRRVLKTQYGDANVDGRVDSSDFNLLATNFGRPGTWATGNFNGDANTDSSDFNLLATNFGFNNMAAGLTASAVVTAAAPSASLQAAAPAPTATNAITTTTKTTTTVTAAKPAPVSKPPAAAPPARKAPAPPAKPRVQAKPVAKPKPGNPLASAITTSVVSSTAKAKAPVRSPGRD